LLVTPEGREEETVKRLARVGYDYTIGYLNGGFAAWLASGKEIDKVDEVEAQKFGALAKESELNVIDVRKPGEYGAEHVEGVENKPLDFINDWMGEINKNTKYYLHCAGGYRSMITASILKSRGFDEVVNIK